MTGDDQGKPSFGDKLAYLIETVHPPDRGLYRYREIAAGIAEHPRAMTAAPINQLVRGFAGEAAVPDAPWFATCRYSVFIRSRSVAQMSAERPPSVDDSGIRRRG